MESKELLRKVEEIRFLRGYTQYEVCKRAGLSRMTFLNWKLRESLPKLETLEAICQTLDYPIARLFGEEVELLGAEQVRLNEYWATLSRDEKDAVFSVIYAFANKKAETVDKSFPQAA